MKIEAAQRLITALSHTKIVDALTHVAVLKQQLENLKKLEPEHISEIQKALKYLNEVNALVNSIGEER